MYFEGMFDENSFLSLDKLARQLRLPRHFLRDLATKGMIPALEVRGRLRFSLVEVQKSLNRLAKRVNRGQGERPDGQVEIDRPDIESLLGNRTDGPAGENCDGQ